MWCFMGQQTSKLYVCWWLLYCALKLSLILSWSVRPPTATLLRITTLRKITEFCSFVAIDSPNTPGTLLLSAAAVAYLGSAQFEQWQGHRLSWLKFQWFFSDPTGNVWLVLGLRHDQLFPNPFQFISRTLCTINRHLVIFCKNTFNSV